MTTTKPNQSTIHVSFDQRKIKADKSTRCDAAASEQAKVLVLLPNGGALTLCRHHANKHFPDRFEWELKGYEFVDLIPEGQDRQRSGGQGLTDAD